MSYLSDVIYERSELKEECDRLKSRIVELETQLAAVTTDAQRDLRSFNEAAAFSMEMIKDLKRENMELRDQVKAWKDAACEWANDLETPEKLKEKIHQLPEVY